MTLHPIVKVAIGCRMEPAIVQIVCLMQKLHFFCAIFQFFLSNYTSYREKKYMHRRFFFWSYYSYNYMSYRKKKTLFPPPPPPNYTA